MLRPLISFVVSWTQSAIEHNIGTKQLHSTRLTQWSLAHRYFWEGGRARFPALSSSPHSTYSRWGLNQVIAAATQWVRRRPVAITIFEAHENHEWRMGLPGNWLYHRDKTFVQRAALHSAERADTEDVQMTYTMEHSSPIIREPVPTENRHTTTACAGRHILRVVTLSTRFVN